MKILYLAFNPDRASSLVLEREITSFQRAASKSGGEPIEVIFLPQVYFEALPTEISTHGAEIIHISAHGEGSYLVAGTSVADAPDAHVTAEMLLSFFDVEKPPKLVYINACNSHDMAKIISKKVSAIGNTQEITNFAAVSTATLFYQKLIEGRSVGIAFEASRKFLGGLDEGEIILEQRPGFDAKKFYFHRPTRLVARFENTGSTKTKIVGEKQTQIQVVERRTYNIELGLVGCPSGTTQVVFFSDDETFINDPDNLEQDMSEIARTSPVNGELWLQVSWTAYGDYRIFACGVAPNGSHFSVGDSVSNALERFYMMALALEDRSEIPAEERNAIACLRRNDGSLLGADRGSASKKPIKRRARTKSQPRSKIRKKK